MGKFYLIQRGTFNDLKGKYSGLTGKDGLIDLDYMGSSEFEWGAIPKAYRRIMGQKDDYIFHYCNTIKDYKGKILVIYCKKEYAETIEKEIKNFIDKHYSLKEYCTLEDHIKGPSRWNTYSIKKDFFWCIDIGKPTSDWMGWFGMDKLAPFKKMIDYDYNEWWMKQDAASRKKKYEEAQCW